MLRGSGRQIPRRYPRWTQSGDEATAARAPRAHGVDPVGGVPARRGARRPRAGAGGQARRRGARAGRRAVQPGAALRADRRRGGAGGHARAARGRVRLRQLGGPLAGRRARRRPGGRARVDDRPGRRSARRREPRLLLRARARVARRAGRAGRAGRGHHPRRRRQGRRRARDGRAAADLLARRRRAAGRHRAARARRALDRDPRELRGARMSGAALIGGYAADLALGDPRRFHPVAGFGRVAEATERAAYAPSRARGAAYAGTLVALAALAGRRAPLAALTWAALGGRSLAREGLGIGGELARGGLAAARAALPALAGRDPSGLDEGEICRATVESVAENTS